jgi:hypothetical protein
VIGQTRFRVALFGKKFRINEAGGGVFKAAGASSAGGQSQAKAAGIRKRRKQVRAIGDAARYF